MLEIKQIRIDVMPVAGGRYFLSAEDFDGFDLQTSVWKKLLFFRHKESYYGTMADSDKWGGTEGVILSAWQLVTLFGEESFNRLVEWEWDEIGDICLSTAHAVYDAILAKEWHPDFAQLDGEDFRWALPESVLDEFHEPFWNETIKVKEESISVRAFAEDLFHHALES